MHFLQKIGKNIRLTKDDNFIIIDKIPGIDDGVCAAAPATAFLFSALSVDCAQPFLRRWARAAGRSG